MYFCPKCGCNCLEWLDGVHMWVCDQCNYSYTIIGWGESPDKLRSVRDE